MVTILIKYVPLRGLCQIKTFPEVPPRAAEMVRFSLKWHQAPQTKEARRRIPSVSRSS